MKMIAVMTLVLASAAALVTAAEDAGKQAAKTATVIDTETGAEVYLLHSAITGDHDPETNERLRDVTIEDLVIDGRAQELNLPRTSFRQAGIHLNRTDNLIIRKVTVRNWHTDGISAQQHHPRQLP